MSKATVIKNVLVVNRGKIYSADVFIKKGRIEKITPHLGNVQEAHIEINGEGKHLMPGIIDDQVHFREPGLEHKGTIYTESRAGIAGGVTSWMDQPNVNPKTTTWELLQQKQEIGRTTSFGNYGFNIGAVEDNLDSLKYLVENHRNQFAGIKIFMGSSTGNMLVDKIELLEQLFQLGKHVITHCEDELTIKRNYNDMLDIYGKDIPMYKHPVIRSKEACFKSSSLAVSLAKKHKTRLHVYHISTEDELVLFTNDIPLEDKLITAEVCLHHLYFDSDDYEALGSSIKWNPAVKDKHHKVALLAALLDDRLDIFATDHAPHTKEEKAKLYGDDCPSGGPMVQHLLPGAIQLLGADRLPLFVQKACHNPATLFKIQDRGFLDEGCYADAVLIDTNSPWTVSDENILYKCGWSPMNGKTFNTKVLGTWVNGELLYDNRGNNPSGIGSFAETSSAMQLQFAN